MEEFANYATCYKASTPLKWSYHLDRVGDFLHKGPDQVKPVTIYLFPTLRCNHHCYFCTYGGPLAKDNRHDLPLEAVHRIFDEASIAGVKGCMFTGGGDPSLYPHLVQAMQYAKSKGIDVAMNTNGYRMPPQMAKDLIALGPEYIRISLNSGSPMMQKLITGVDNFEIVMANIKNLVLEKVIQQSKTDISIGCVVNVVNVVDIFNLVQSVRALEREIEELTGCLGEVIYSIQFRPVNNDKHENEKNRKAIIDYLKANRDEEDFEEFMKFIQTDYEISDKTLKTALQLIEEKAIPYLQKEGSRIHIIYPKPKYQELQTVQKKQYSKCLACSWYLYIWANGNVYQCWDFVNKPGFEIGNVLQEGLTKIINGNKKQENLKYINEHAITQLCPVLCFQHKLNVLLDSLQKNGEAGLELVEKIKESSEAPRHLNII